MPRPLCWGLIGASTIAREYMIPAIRANPDSRVSAVYSSSLERGEAFAGTHGIPQACETLESLLDDPGIDVVYISTTNERHAREAISAAMAGKHVFCEKPLATDLGDARAIVTTCRQAGVVLGTNHHLPNAATHRTLRRLVAEGAVGALRAVRVFHARWLPPALQSWRTTDPTAGAGVILDVTVHDAALVRFLLDEDIVVVAASAFRQSMAGDGIEDAVMGVFETASGVPVMFHDAWTVPHGGTGLEIHGAEGSLIARDVMTSDPVGRVHLRRWDKLESVDVGDQEDLYVHCVRHFNSAVRGMGSPVVSGEDGVRALAVALAVKEAAASGRHVEVESTGA
jgi:1,5-anhydro-D-fructose reductase (1,5-anhydro-D-mannitol-forming)